MTEISVGAVVTVFVVSVVGGLVDGSLLGAGEVAGSDVLGVVGATASADCVVGVVVVVLEVSDGAGDVTVESLEDDDVVAVDCDEVVSTATVAVVVVVVVEVVEVVVEAVPTEVPELDVEAVVVVEVAEVLDVLVEVVVAEPVLSVVVTFPTIGVVCVVIVVVVVVVGVVVVVSVGVFELSAVFIGVVVVLTVVVAVFTARSAQLPSCLFQSPFLIDTQYT